LKGSSNGRPRYFKGREKTSHLKMPAKSSVLTISSTGTNTELAKLIFKPEIASKKKKDSKKTEVIKISSAKD
jgi:hypothetical protein